MRREKVEQKKRQRQTAYLDALGTLSDFKMFKSHYLPKDVQCRQCGAQWTHHEEKMTDVNIAAQMLVDGFNDVFDTAIVISGDSDLGPPTLALRQQFAEKRSIVTFPPKRSSVQLKRAASANFVIGRSCAGAEREKGNCGCGSCA
jgi:uncharacterized LabA/DUF88 family protein